MKKERGCRIELNILPKKSSISKLISLGICVGRQINCGENELKIAPDITSWLVTPVLASVIQFAATFCSQATSNVQYNDIVLGCSLSTLVLNHRSLSQFKQKIADYESIIKTNHLSNQLFAKSTLLRKHEIFHLNLIERTESG